MVKKLKLISTVVVLCFVAIIIPIAIMAAGNVNPGISSTLQYLVEDIEGEFYYKIYGNAQSTTHDVSVAELFHTQPNETTGNIDLISGLGGVLTQGETISISNNGILFDDTHQTVSYYFVFVNWGENEPDTDDDRSVNIRANSNNWDNFDEHISATWSYVIKQKADKNSLITETDIDIEENANTIVQGDAGFTLQNGVVLDAFDTETEKYNYIIIKYELDLDTTTNSFSTSMNLTINLTSNQNSN